MALGVKISQLPVATPLTGAELVEVVQGGISKQTSVLDVQNPGAGPALLNSVRSLVLSDTALTSDGLLVVDATGGVVVVTLFPAAGRTGAYLNIKRVNGGPNKVTVAAAGAETIDGAPTIDLNSQYDNLAIASDGTEWRVM